MTRLQSYAAAARTVALALAMLALAGPESGAQATHSALGARLDSALRAAESRGFSGVVLVERDGQVVLEQGYGLADRSAGRRMTPQTVVQIGSNTKDFTAVAVLRMVQEGRLALDDSLYRFFPSAPADKRAITVRQLLDHRAGFPLGLGGDFERVTRDALVDSAMRTPLRFAPGARESYSNTGYSLLAAILELRSGRTYDVLLHETILAPLGLTRTGLLLPRFGATDVAHGYLASGSDRGTMLDRAHAPDGPWWNLRGNGGMLSTVGEMRQFYAALFESEQLLSPAVRRLRFDPSQPTGLAGSDGVSFFLYERLPAERTVLIIASTNQAVRAPVVRRALGALLGLPSPGGDEGERVAARPGGRPPTSAEAAVLGGLVRALEGDVEGLRRFVAEHFTSGDGAPTVEERVARLRAMRERLGAITLQGMTTFATGPAEIAIRAANEDEPVVVIVDLVREGAPRIRSLQVRAGG